MIFENTMQKITGIYTTVFLLLFALNLSAQGSRSFYPAGAQGNRAYLACTTDAGDNGNSWPYLTMGTHYVYAIQGEVICAAFSARSQGTGTGNANNGGRIRITSPTGVQYITGTDAVTTSGNGITNPTGIGNGGLINNRAQELAGPRDGNGSPAAGYTPFTVTVPSGQTGVWRVEFFPRGINIPNVDSNPANIPNLRANAPWDQSNQPKGTDASAAFVAAWDVSVRSGNTWKPGRVYTNVLNLLLPSEWEESESFYANTYVLTKDGVAYRIKYDGNQGAGWTFFTNNKGFIGPDGNASYKSLNFSNRAQVEPFLHNPTGPDDVVNNRITHKMFYTTPSPDLPNTLTTQVALAPGGGLTTWLKNPRLLPQMTSLTFEGVEGTSGQSGSKGAYIRFNSNVKGLYKITIPSTVPKVLTGPCEVGMNEVYWDGKDGNGAYLPAGTNITQVTTQLYGAEVHFPYIDMEINPNGIVIEQLDDNYAVISGMDKVYWDDTSITGGDASRDPEPRFNGNTGNGISSNDNGHKWGIHTANPVNPTGTPLWVGQPDNNGTGNGDFGNTRSIDTWSYAPGASASAALQIVVMATDLRVNAVNKIAGPNIVSVGNNLTYEVPIFNNGPSHATTAATKPATFFFYVPKGITINPNAVSFHSSVNGATPVGTKTFDPVTGIFKVTVDMPNQSGGTFQIPVSVTGGVPDDTVNVWGAIMRPEDISDPDATNLDITIDQPTDAFEEANEIWQHSSELPIYTNPTAINLANTNNIKLNNGVQMYANVALTKTVSPAGSHNINQQVVFTITATNNGLSNASYVKVTDLLGTRYGYVSHTVSTGTYNNVSGIWNIGTLNNGATATMTITATIRGTGGDQVNTAVITADEYDTVLANNTASATTNAPMVSDVAITKVGYASVTSLDNTGNGVTSFTLTVKNNGPSDATNVVVTDVLSARYDFSDTEYIVSKGTVSTSGTQQRNITWTIPYLANGAVATMIFTPENNTGSSSTNPTWANTATVTRDQTDNVPSNNSSTITPTASGTAVNLTLNKDVSNPTPNVGQNVTFTITATRPGQFGVTISGVIVTDILPSGYSYVSHSATNGTYTPSTGIWDIGVINSSTPRVLSVVATVNAPAGIEDEYKNIAAITGISEVDSSPVNNVDDAEVDPLVADIIVDKNVTPPVIRAGNNVQFTIVVTNNGPDQAANVTVNDLLPAGYAYVSHTATTGSAVNNYNYISGTGVWTVGNLANGASQTLTIIARVNGTGDLLNTATGTSDTTYDPNTANNTDNISIVRKMALVITNPMIRSKVQ